MPYIARSSGEDSAWHVARWERIDPRVRTSTRCVVDGGSGPQGVNEFVNREPGREAALDWTSFGKDRDGAKKIEGYTRIAYGPLGPRPTAWFRGKRIVCLAPESPLKHWP